MIRSQNALKNGKQWGNIKKKKYYVTYIFLYIYKQIKSLNFLMGSIAGIMS